jgi:hypothetical protein
VLFSSRVWAGQRPPFLWARTFFVRPSLLRGAQMFGALLWIVYGLLINASPVIVANVLVFAAAAWTTLRKTRVSPGASSDLSA